MKKGSFTSLKNLLCLESGFPVAHYSLFFIISILFITTCGGPLSHDIGASGEIEAGTEGTARLIFPSDSPDAALSWDSTVTIGQLAHVVTFEQGGSVKKTDTIPAGGGVKNISVPAGTYNIRIKAYLGDEKPANLKAEGVKEKEIVKGDNPDLIIPMGPPLEGLDRIEINPNPNAKTVYAKGEPFDHAGFTVKLVYTDKADITIPYTIYHTEFDSETAGTKTVKVSFGGKEAGIDVTVENKRLAGIEIDLSSLGTVKQNYIEGHEASDIDLAGLIVKAQYIDDENPSNILPDEVVPNDDLEIEIYDSAGTKHGAFPGAGSYMVRIVYGDEYDEYAVNVAAKQLTGITVSETAAFKKTYVSGESINPAGLVVHAYFDNGHSEIVASGFTFNPNTFSTVGSTTVTVSYTNGGVTQTATITVTVVGGSYDNTFDVYNETDWDNAKSTISSGGGNKAYLINVMDDFAVAGVDVGTYTFGSIYGVTVEIKGTSAGKTVSLSSNGRLLNVGAGLSSLTVILRDLTLKGLGPATSNGGPLIYLSGNSNILEMNDGVKITGTTNGGQGGGVYVDGGTFNMNGGEISGNYSKTNGGGVGVYNGIFNMSGGKISGNTADSDGGGVWVRAGTFNMSGGEISGNTATGTVIGGGGGGGVATFSSAAIFHIANGTIYGSYEPNAALRNTSGTSGSAALVKGTTNSIEEYGTFDGSGNWTATGTLTSTDDTIKVVNGVLQP